jgi:hypothetical protein
MIDGAEATRADHNRTAADTGNVAQIPLGNVGSGVDFNPP